MSSTEVCLFHCLRFIQKVTVAGYYVVTFVCTSSFLSTYSKKVSSLQRLLRTPSANSQIRNSNFFMKDDIIYLFNLSDHSMK